MKVRKYEEYHRINTNGNEEKQCKVCNEWLELNSNNFGADNKSKDKFNNMCRTCQREYNHNIYLKDPELRKKQAMQWKRDNPEKRKNNDAKHNRTLKHREIANKNHKRRTENGEIKQWQKKNKYRLKEYANKHRQHDITKQEWKDCQEAFNFCCAYCNKTLENQYIQNKEQFHKDHVDDNGANDLSNCVPACTNCNSKKHEKSISELYESKEIETFTLTNYNKIISWITEEYLKYIVPKPPYKIFRKKNEDNRTYHWELWTVDEKRNIIECVVSELKKKDIYKYIKLFFKDVS